MSTNMNLLNTYSESITQFPLPQKIQGTSMLRDPQGNFLLKLAFNTHRDIITEIGFDLVDTCPKELRACICALCELAKDQKVMAAQLLGPQDIASVLSDDKTLDDTTFYNAVLSVLALKDAISNYASYRSANL